MKKLLSLFFLMPFLLLAQKPVITSISPTHVEFGETVTITGSDLGGATATVFFGSVQSTTVSGDDNIITAEVPAGAYQGPITVLNNNLVAQSSQHFFISFGGSDAPSFGTESLTATTEQNAFDICTCDLNGDNLNDIIITHENFNNADNFSEFTYFINNSTPTTTDFGTANEVNLSAPLTGVDGFVSVECADLNNDGNNDVVFIGSESLTSPVLVFDDITVANPTATQLELPRTSDNNVRDARGLAISDIDGDGLKDVIVGNETDNTLHVYRNRDDFNFDAAVEITVSGASSAGSVEVADMNGDLLPDIAVVPFASNEGIFLLRNNSLSGSISFLSQDPITNADTRRNLKIGDFNNDGFPDIAATVDGSSLPSGVERVAIFENTSSTNGDITFSFLENISIPTNLPWGVDLADLNGDGLLDIVLSCVGSSGTGEVYVIENNSTSSISFEDPTAQNIAADARNITVADLNGDAKPDLAYTHDISLNSIGDLGVQMNTTCIDPIITPSSFSYCSGENFTLSATNTPNGTYNWTATPSGVTPTVNGNEATFNITSTADQTIQVEITQDGCTTAITEQITVSFAAGSTPSAPTIQVNDVNGGASLCEGEELILSESTGFDNYLWTLPDGSTSTSSTISITEVSPTDAGTYSLLVRNSGGCSSQESTASVSIEVIPTPIIQNDSDIIFCADGANNPDLTISAITGASYQWKRDGINISGETGTSITASTSGDYTVEVTNANGCVKESGALTLQAVPEPNSTFSGVSEICQNISTTFMATSMGETGFTLEYAWRVDSSGVTIATSSNADFDYTFTSPNAFNYDVVLTTGYSSDEVASCQDEETLVVNVTPPPAVSFNITNGIQKCSAESLDVSVTNTGVDSYSWSLRNGTRITSNDTIISLNASTTSSLSVTTPTGVDSVYAIVEIMTTIGCTTRDSVLVRNFPSDVDISSSDFTTILERDSALLEETISIDLEAVNVVSNFSWEPADQIDNPTNPSITFFPQSPIDTVILTGIDVDGCLVSTSVIIELDNLRPKKAFSPNGDGDNDCWEILNIGDIGAADGCQVFIFDARGKNIDVIKSFQDQNCVWNGNFEGSPVPEGIYYYILKCNSDEFSKSGSILLAR